MCKTTAEHGDTFSELVLAVVKSDPFQMRSPKAAGSSKPAKSGAESQK
jgi:hypothetical protein